MSSLFGLPHDQLKFLVAEIISFGCGVVFRTYLEPNEQNVKLRHFVSFVIGFSLSFFCFGCEAFNLVLASFVTYLFIRFSPRKYVQLLTFVFLMSYLSGIHLYYQIYHYAEKVFDISGPMMIITQKLTLLAFSFYDGLQSEDKLNPDQKSQSIKQRPKLLEFFSFSFNFQSVLVGPTCLYNDYIDFITGESILKHQKKSLALNGNGLANGNGLSNGNGIQNGSCYLNGNGNSNGNGISNGNGHSNGNGYHIAKSKPKIVQPSNFEPIIRKLSQVVLFAFIFLKLEPIFPYYKNYSKGMYSQPMWYRLIYLYISAACYRCKYYIAWVLADLASNASGLGFNGYDEHGKAKWNLVTGVNVYALETSTSVKMFLDNWNITTQAWLRRIAYDRLKTGSGKTLGVFILSAFWHGFYPGYYITFIQIAFSVYGGRKVRKIMRPYFQKNQVLKTLYAIVGWINTLFIICYATASFIILEYGPCVEFYNSFYWIGHIVTAMLILVLPIMNTSYVKKKLA